MISHQRAWGRGLCAIRHDPDSTLNFASGLDRAAREVG